MRGDAGVFLSLLDYRSREKLMPDAMLSARSTPGRQPELQPGLLVSGTRPASLSTKGCFLLGLGGMTFVRLIGYLAFTEVYFLVTMPWRFGRFLPLITRGTAGVVFALWIGWVIAALASDLTNDVLFELLARGVSRAVLTGVATLSIFIICYPSMKRLERILLGIAFSMIISMFYFRPGQMDFFGNTAEDLLKFDTSINYVLTGFIIASSAIFYERVPWLVITGLFACGPLYILLGSRSAGAIYILAAVTTTGCRLLLSRSLTATRLGFGRLVIIITFAVLAGVAVRSGYEYAVETGMVSEKAVQKNQREKQSKGGLFVSARGVYILTGILAWCDKPILGHGSWPADDVGYYARAAEMVGRDVKETRLMVKGKAVRTLLPVHSQLFGALVEHGVLAFAFFAYMTWLVLWSITFVPALFPRYTALFGVLYWLNLWNFVASPQSHRIPAAAGWAFFLLAYAYRAAQERREHETRRRMRGQISGTYDVSAPAAQVA